MKMYCMRGWWIVGLIAVSGLFLTSCKPRVIDRGQTDLQALGYGLARELGVFLTSGDRVVVFTTPGALGAGAKAEQEAVAGLAKALKVEGIEVVSVSYTPEEIQTYQQSYATHLLESFASEAMKRADGMQAQAFVSLVGWPNTAWLPKGTVVLAVDWNPSASMPWWKSYRGVVQVVARDHLASAPSTDRFKRPEDALVWFDERFAVEVRTR